MELFTSILRHFLKFGKTKTEALYSPVFYYLEIFPISSYSDWPSRDRLRSRIVFAGARIWA